MTLLCPSYWVGRVITLCLADGRQYPRVRVLAANDAEQWIEVRIGDRVEKLATRQVVSVKPEALPDS